MRRTCRRTRPFAVGALASTFALVFALALPSAVRAEPQLPRPAKTSFGVPERNPLAPQAPAQTDAVVPPPELVGGAAADPAATGEPAFTTYNDAGQPVVNVLIVYSGDLAAVYDVRSGVQGTLDQAEEAYDTSGISLDLKLVGQVLMPGPDVPLGNYNMEPLLNALAGTQDAYYRDVQRLRDAYRADLVALIVPYATDGCGIGYLGTPDGRANAAGYTITAAECVGNHSFTHELGHNLGAAHDPVNAGKGGAYPYSFGFVYPPGGWTTIMAYTTGNGCNLCTRQNFFSNPALTFIGVPTGTASANNALTLTNMAPIASAYRSGTLPASPGGWQAANLDTAASTGSGASTASFNGALYAFDAGSDKRVRIGRRVGTTWSAFTAPLNPACNGTSLSTIVAYGQLHVFAEGGTAMCHGWTGNGTTWFSELLDPPGGGDGGNSTGQGVSSAIYLNQLHAVSRGVTGGATVVRDVWWDPVKARWGDKTIANASNGSPSTTGETSAAVYSGQYHVVYATSSGELRDVWYDPSSGVFRTTTGFGAVPNDLVEPAASIAASGTFFGQFHIAYNETFGTLAHRWYDPVTGGWGFERMAGDVAGGGSLGAPGRVRTIMYGEQFHVLFGGSMGEVGHVYWDPGAGRWFREALDRGGSRAVTGLGAAIHDGRFHILSEGLGAGAKLRHVAYSP